MLLDQGANVNMQEGWSIRQPITVSFWGKKRQRGKSMRMLLEEGADVCAQADGTATHYRRL